MPKATNPLEANVLLIHQRVASMGREKLYTVGYGNDSPDVFLGRLQAAGVTLVVDIRRANTKSWSGSYNWGTGGGLDRLLRSVYKTYVPWASLANNYDTLEGYQKWLNSSGMNWVETLAAAINHEWVIEQGIALLCAEGKPYETDGTPRCHRVYVADALVKLLGEKWEVVHL